MRADVKVIAEGHGALEKSVAGLDARADRRSRATGRPTPNVARSSHAQSY